MSYEQILLETQGDVAVLTLNRPARLNAWTYQMSRELTDAISRCNQDDAIGAMVVTGAGRGFCAGADIKDNFSSLGSSLGEARIDGRIDGKADDSPGDWIGLVRSSKPLIAAVNGASVGVGATMILPMDVIVASEQAKFAMAFIKMGLTPELASSHFLVQRMGFGRASEMCLSGRLYSGAEAYEMGLADRVVEHDKLMESALEIASTIAANPGPQLRWVKELLTQNGSETDITAVQRREGEALRRAYVSAEHTEAVNAFLEKREPNFS